MIFRMAERILKKVLNDEFGLDEFKYEMNDNGDLIATNSITIKAFDDDIYCRFRLTEDDLVVYSFTFDKLEKTDRALRLINTFNENCMFFKAHCDDEYLKIQHVAYVLNEDDLEEYTTQVMNALVGDHVKEYLEPLCDLTHS